MALADSRAYCLSRLIPCAVLHNDILIRARPSLLLVASGLKDTLIGEDEVATVTDDLVDLVPQLDGLVGIRLVELVLLLRHILGLHLLELGRMFPGADVLRDLVRQNLVESRARHQRHRWVELSSKVLPLERLDILVRFRVAYGIPLLLVSFLVLTTTAWTISPFLI